MVEWRVQKVLAHAGVCSRRKAEELIVQGRVLADGNVVKIGDVVDPAKVKLSVDGEQVVLEKKV